MISRARAVAVMVLLAVLLVGVAGGWVLDEVVDEVEWPWARQDGGRHEHHDHDDGPMDDDVEERFLEGLGLSPRQHQAVERLLDEREDRLEEYWQGRLPAIEAMVDSTRSRIRSLLAPDQRAAYDRWVEEQRGRALNR